MTRAARKDDVIDALSHLRMMHDALGEQIDDMARAHQPADGPQIVSARISLEHARLALRLARGLPAAPSTRQRISSAYRMVCAELGVDE